MSACNFPAFNISFSIPIPLPGIPTIDFGFTLAFTLPGCPLD